MALFAITCPHCRKQGKGPIELNGKKIRCRNCGRVFMVQLAQKGSSPSPPAAPPMEKGRVAGPAAQGKTRPSQPSPQGEPQKGPGTYAFAGEGAVPAAEALPPVHELAVSAMDEDEISNPYDLKDVDLARRCPFCAEEMDEEAIVCVNCGFNTQTRKHHQTQRTYANTPGDVFLWLLPGILSVVGIFAVIGFDLFWWFGLESIWWQPLEKSTGVPKISLCIQVWVVFVSLFAIYKLAKFAVIRLILHPTPPEEQKY